MFFSAALAFAFMGCPGGGGGGTGGGSGATGGGSGTTTGGGTGSTTGGGHGTTGGGTGTTTGGGTGTTTGGGTGTTTGGGTGTTTGGGTGTTTGGGTGTTTGGGTGTTTGGGTGTTTGGGTGTMTGGGTGTTTDGGAGWTCDADWYGTDDGCDCGCGIVDPDCDDADIATCEYCDCDQSGSPVMCGATDSTQCVPLTGWTCDADWYADGDYCDCGCGVRDVDCTPFGSVNDNTTCSDCGCADGSYCNPTNTNACLPAPSGWTCPSQLYSDGNECDCGCGVQDPDCTSTTDISECQACGCATTPTDGGFNSSTCNSTNTTACTASTFVPWTCDAASFGDGFECNCGCGGQDLDCSSTTGVGTCDVCECSTDGGYCNPSNNTACLPIPAAWTCSDFVYGNGLNCNCGCGVVDPDCGDAGVTACTICTSTGSCTQGPDGGLSGPSPDGGACALINPTNNAVCQ